MQTLIRIMRALELLGRLEILVPEAIPGPMDLVWFKGKARKGPTASDEPHRKILGSG